MRMIFASVLAALALQPAAPPKQAVVETPLGTFVIDLTPEAAPNQVAYFMKTAQDGGYDGTIFHRVIKYGMVQGGDPVTKDPSKRSQYGTGGLNAVKAEPRAAKITAGSVAAVLVSGRPDSAGAQFIIFLADQPALDGQFTVFGRVTDGQEILQKISETPIDAGGLTTERVEIKRVTIRDTPPPAPPAFSTETVAELSGYRATLDTSAGPITLEFLPNLAQGHVRQFLRLAQAGVYDGVAFHRVVPGFVIQSGALGTRTVPLTPKQQALVQNLAPEFSPTKHVKGIVSMARGDDPGSANTSFFIVTGDAPALDNQYSVFARVVEGIAAVEAIESTPRTGETPNNRIEIKAVRIEKRATP